MSPNYSLCVILAPLIFVVNIFGIRTSSRLTDGKTTHKTKCTVVHKIEKLTEDNVIYWTKSNA